MKVRKAWLSRQRDGNYMFSILRPSKHKIIGSDAFDFYLVGGEPIGLRYFCPSGVKLFFNIDIPIGEQIQVWVAGGILEGDDLDESKK